MYSYGSLIFLDGDALCKVVRAKYIPLGENIVNSGSKSIGFKNTRCHSLINTSRISCPPVETELIHSAYLYVAKSIRSSGAFFFSSGVLTFVLLSRSITPSVQVIICVITYSWYPNSWCWWSLLFFSIFYGVLVYSRLLIKKHNKTRMLLGMFWGYYETTQWIWFFQQGFYSTR